ncbi:hypothetical protein UQ64_28515 [Paenibacillus etheri]|uniref:Uncharacterized protein n=1 Tax=Paenibacillus etheri TaxID=1306852 RepID=A0A0W1AS05_9BACL|nr:hypothetical protein UQ64_28515 [Paenibacillus etheri]
MWINVIILMKLSYFKYEGGVPDEKEIPKIFVFWYWVFYCCFFLELMMDRIGLSKIKRNQAKMPWASL